MGPSNEQIQYQTRFAMEVFNRGKGLVKVEI